MQSSFTCVLLLFFFFPLVVDIDIIVFRLGLVCPPCGNKKKRKRKKGRCKKEQKKVGEMKKSVRKKKRNYSGVGIQLTTIIIIQCNRYSLMKRESAGELLIRSESSSIHSLFFHLLIRYCARKHSNNDI
jgi:hypothetical protein